ncbi:MAG: methyltransferase family protein [Candidatus Promineifilaceae bacterium]
MFFIQLFTIIVFLSLAYEIWGIPVPSIASTVQLFSTEDGYDVAGSRLLHVRQWSTPLKTVALLLPTALSVIVYLLPLVQALWPVSAEYLHPMWAISPFTITSGVILATAGRAISLYSAWRIRQNNRQTDDSFELKTRGLFDHSRNPLQVGMYVCFAGLWLLYPTWEMAIGFLLYVANIHFRILLEEDFLAWKFGQSYLDYKATHRRYV